MWRFAQSTTAGLALARALVRLRQAERMLTHPAATIGDATAPTSPVCSATPDQDRAAARLSRERPIWHRVKGPQFECGSARCSSSGTGNEPPDSWHQPRHRRHPNRVPDLDVRALRRGRVGHRAAASIARTSRSAWRPGTGSSRALASTAMRKVSRGVKREVR
jgi:hypothetical protein